MKQKISMGSQEDLGFWEKTFNFTFRDIFHPYFSRFLKPMKYFAKMLRYWVTVQISKSDGLPRSSKKRKTVRRTSWNKRFQWVALKTVDFDKKTFNFNLRDIFHSYFSRFLKPMKYFAKMLRYWVTVQISKSDGLPRSSNKRKTVRRPLWKKRFQWVALKTVDFDKKLLISICEIFFTHIFRVFWSLWNILRKCLDIELLYRYPSLMVFHGLLTKGRSLEARHERKDFNGNPGRPWILTKNF